MATTLLGGVPTTLSPVSGALHNMHTCTNTSVNVNESALGLPVPTAAPRERLDEVSRELVSLLQYYGELSWNDLRRVLSVDCRRAYDAVNVLLATGVISQLENFTPTRSANGVDVIRKPPLRLGDGEPLPGIVQLQHVLPTITYNLTGTLVAMRRSLITRAWAATPPAARVSTPALAAIMATDEKRYRAWLASLDGNGLQEVLVKVGEVRAEAATIARRLADSSEILDNEVADFVRMQPGDARACYLCHKLISATFSEPLPSLVIVGHAQEMSRWLEEGRVALRT